eukprot:125114-Rhodomonas_salina.3
MHSCALPRHVTPTPSRHSATRHVTAQHGTSQRRPHHRVTAHTITSRQASALNKRHHSERATPRHKRKRKRDAHVDDKGLDVDGKGGDGAVDADELGEAARGHGRGRRRVLVRDVVEGLARVVHGQERVERRRLPLRRHRHVVVEVRHRLVALRLGDEEGVERVRACRVDHVHRPAACHAPPPLSVSPKPLRFGLADEGSQRVSGAGFRGELAGFEGERGGF